MKQVKVVINILESASKNNIVFADVEKANAFLTTINSNLVKIKDSWRSEITLIWGESAGLRKFTHPYQLGVFHDDIDPIQDTLIRKYLELKQSILQEERTVELVKLDKQCVECRLVLNALNIGL